MKTLGTVLLMLALSGLYAWDTCTWCWNGRQTVAGYRMAFSFAHAANANTYVYLDVVGPLPQCKTLCHYETYDLLCIYEYNQ